LAKNIIIIHACTGLAPRVAGKTGGANYIKDKDANARERRGGVVGKTCKLHRS